MMTLLEFSSIFPLGVNRALEGHITDRSRGLVSMLSIAHLATRFALALFGAPMDPVMVGEGLLAILAHAHISERRLAGKLHPVHKDVDARRVRDDLTR